MITTSIGTDGSSSAHPYPPHLPLPPHSPSPSTPYHTSGEPYTGVEFHKGICGVSVIRSGEAMENALRECCQVWNKDYIQLCADCEFAHTAAHTSSGH